MSKFRSFIHEKYPFVKKTEKMFFFIVAMTIAMYIQYSIVVIGLEFVFLKVFAYVSMVSFSFLFILICVVIIIYVIIFLIYCYEYIKYFIKK
jgi:hypothetical protein